VKLKFLVAVALVLFAGAAVTAALENLTIDQAAQLAVAQNPAMRQAQIRVEKADLAIERLAEITPIHQERSEQDSLSYEQLNTLEAALARAKHGQTLARKGEEVVRNQLILEARQKYLGVRRAGENLDLVRENLRRAENVLRMSETSYNRGMVAKSDVLGAEAQVTAAEARLMLAENTVELAYMELNVAMGRDTASPLELVEPFSLPAPKQVNLNTGLSSALENRFEMVEARGNVDLKRQEFEYAAEHLEPDDSSYKQTALDLEEAEISLRIAEQNIRLQVRQIYSSRDALQMQLEALQKSVDYATESYRIASLRYEAGVATQMEVFSAQANLQEMSTQYLHSRYDDYLTYLQWLFATGQRLE
jgi:outer membrane protein TolC